MTVRRSLLASLLILGLYPPLAWQVYELGASDPVVPPPLVYDATTWRPWMDVRTALEALPPMPRCRLEGTRWWIDGIFVAEIQQTFQASMQLVLMMQQVCQP